MNIILDSQYAVGVAQRIERAHLRHIPKKKWFLKFKELLFLVEQRVHLYCIIHMRRHTMLPGIFAEGNARADQLTNMTLTALVPKVLEQARLSHAFFHQSAKVLAKQFAISITNAKLIVQTHPDCQQHVSTPSLMVNHRGLQSLHLWQTDITHIPQFGCLKYVHISVDTFSHAIWVTVAAGETSRHVQARFRVAFTVLGIPKEIKTDSGPTYTSHSPQTFFQTWGIQHITGIPPHGSSHY